MGRTAIRGAIRRHGLGLVVVALTGLVLGAGIGYGAGAPYSSASNDPILIFLVCGAIAAALLIGLLARALVTWTIDPLVPAAALVVAVVIGITIAPGASGSNQSRPGTGSAGTRQNAMAFWSGTVRCEWHQGDSTVERIVGFDVLVSDPTVLTALGLEGPSKVVAIQLGLSLTGTAMLGVGEDANNFGGLGAPLALEGMAGDGRSGTAVSGNAAILFSWSCTGGP